jgi:hypothetical protein
MLGKIGYLEKTNQMLYHSMVNLQFPPLELPHYIPHSALPTGQKAPA